MKVRWLVMVMRGMCSINHVLTATGAANYCCCCQVFLAHFLCHTNTLYWWQLLIPNTSSVPFQHRLIT